MKGGSIAFEPVATIDVDPVEGRIYAGLEVIRRSIGDAYLVGCGAPILPPLGLLDASRRRPCGHPTRSPAAFRDGSGRLARLQPACACRDDRQS